MELLITIVHVTTCLLLILTVLLQSGRGGGMGAALGGGGGAGSQIFGGRGASTFLTKITSGAAIVFFLTSITLASLGSRKETTGERLLREQAGEAESLSAGSGEQAGTSADEAEAPADDQANPSNDEAAQADPAVENSESDTSDVPLVEPDPGAGDAAPQTAPDAP